jgi:hypothetical protein
MARITLKRGNDQVVTLKGLRTTTPPPIYLNTAIVKATLRDQKEQPIPGFQDISLPYVPGSDGNYEWVIDSTVMMLPKGSEYSLVFVAKQDELDYRVVHPVSVVD